MLKISAWWPDGVTIVFSCAMCVLNKNRSKCFTLDQIYAKFLIISTKLYSAQILIRLNIFISRINELDIFNTLVMGAQKLQKSSIFHCFLSTNVPPSTFLMENDFSDLYTYNRNGYGVFPLLNGVSNWSMDISIT